MLIGAVITLLTYVRYDAFSKARCTKIFKAFNWLSKTAWNIVFLNVFKVRKNVTTLHAGCSNLFSAVPYRKCFTRKKNLFNAKYLQSLQLAEYSFTSFKFKYSSKCNIKD